jgi:hypothetical protein
MMVVSRISCNYHLIGSFGFTTESPLIHQPNFIFRRSKQNNIASILKISAKKELEANQKHNKQIEEQLNMLGP